ncbi:hypothetical protein FD724_38450 (plasmid) [Nostoc sp. C057]|uniref:hypothetical protein n=1 Tax=Nostoc sp. C057 TaxID=2576903 RepID=UPI0015C3E868|nr:hypothetical protein FD724_38450 [Nostoc sp. C057]
MITASGVKPTVSVKWQRGNFWIYGAIEPLTGQHFQQEYPKLSGLFENRRNSQELKIFLIL